MFEVEDEVDCDSNKLEETEAGGVDEDVKVFSATGCVVMLVSLLLTAIGAACLCDVVGNGAVDVAWVVEEVDVDVEVGCAIVGVSLLVTTTGSIFELVLGELEDVVVVSDSIVGCGPLADVVTVSVCNTVVWTVTKRSPTALAIPLRISDMMPGYLCNLELLDRRLPMHRRPHSINQSKQYVRHLTISTVPGVPLFNATSQGTKVNRASENVGND